MPCLHRRAAVGLLVSILVLAPGCSRQSADPQGGSTVSGKVTYNGQPVLYGFVVFYDMKEGLDPKAGTVTPAGLGRIENGAYEAQHVPTGNMMVCVATDPDIPTFQLLAPRKLGAAVDPKGGDPKGGDPKGGDPKGGDPKGGDPKGGGPPGGPPVPPGGPPAVDPAVMALSPEQKQTLKGIHAKYGEAGRSPLVYEVKDIAEQTFDIPLK